MIGDVLLASLSFSELPDTIPLKSVYHAFGELSKSSKYKHWFSSINFVTGPDVPISEELETALFRLCSAGLATVDNPDFRYLRIPDQNRQAMRKVLQRHLQATEPEKLEELEELSKEFQQKVSFWIDHEARKLSLRGP